MDNDLLLRPSLSNHAPAVVPTADYSTSSDEEGENRAHLANSATGQRIDRVKKRALTAPLANRGGALLPRAANNRGEQIIDSKSVASPLAAAANHSNTDHSANSSGAQLPDSFARPLAAAANHSNAVAGHSANNRAAQQIDSIARPLVAAANHRNAVTDHNANNRAAQQIDSVAATEVTDRANLPRNVSGSCEEEEFFDCLPPPERVTAEQLQQLQEHAASLLLLQTVWEQVGGRSEEVNFYLGLIPAAVTNQETFSEQLRQLFFAKIDDPNQRLSRLRRWSMKLSFSLLRPIYRGGIEWISGNLIERLRHQLHAKSQEDFIGFFRKLMEKLTSYLQLLERVCQDVNKMTGIDEQVQARIHREAKERIEGIARDKGIVAWWQNQTSLYDLAGNKLITDLLPKVNWRQSCRQKLNDFLPSLLGKPILWLVSLVIYPCEAIANGALYLFTRQVVYVLIQQQAAPIEQAKQDPGTQFNPFREIIADQLERYWELLQCPNPQRMEQKSSGSLWRFPFQLFRQSIKLSWQLLLRHQQSSSLDSQQQQIVDSLGLEKMTKSFFEVLPKATTETYGELKKAIEEDLSWRGKDNIRDCILQELGNVLNNNLLTAYQAATAGENLERQLGKCLSAINMMLSPLSAATGSNHKQRIATVVDKIITKSIQDALEMSADHYENIDGYLKPFLKGYLVEIHTIIEQFCKFLEDPRRQREIIDFACVHYLAGMHSG